jgi:hypothetical protein
VQREQNVIVTSASSAAGGDALSHRRAVRLVGVGKCTVLQTKSVYGAYYTLSTWTDAVPGAGTAVVRALVALEDVDEHARVRVVVDRARAAGGGARCHRRTVGLVGVLERAGDVLPGAGAARVGALVALHKCVSG